jgi:tetratricopeptide (TPR) repeat protein
MVWLDPRECIAARDALRQGNPTEAARLLVASRNPQHRAVRALLGEISRSLAEEARKHFEARRLEEAKDTLDLAGRCMVLDGEALALQRQIVAALDEHQQQEAWASAQLDQARRLAEHGRLQTALDVLRTLAAHPKAAPLRNEVEQQLGSLRRHLEACRQSLQAGQAQVAYRHWQQARSIAPEDPQVAELSGMIARTLSADSGSSEQVAAVRERAQRFVLDDLALVVSTGEVVLGTPRGDGVHVPLYGPLHGRHAVILRDRHGWQLVPCRDRHGNACPAWVGGQKADGPCRLVDGSLIQLGSTEGAWRFRLPVPGSATAVLEPAPGSPPCVSAGRRRLARVVLLDEELRVRPAPPAHLVLPDLPCKEFLLRWREGGLEWGVDGGNGRVELDGRTLDQGDSQLRLPCRLIIEPQLDEAELLGREVAGCGPASRLVLELTDPAPRTGQRS